MSIFPTQYSTLSAIALKYHIETAYGLTGLSCRLLIRNVSDTYLLGRRSRRILPARRSTQ